MLEGETSLYVLGIGNIVWIYLIDYIFWYKIAHNKYMNKNKLEIKTRSNTWDTNLKKKQLQSAATYTA